MYKLKALCYKILFKISKNEKYYQKYKKYKTSDKNNDLQNIKNELNEIKKLIVLNSIFSTNPYIVNSIDFENHIESINFSTNSFINDDDNLAINDLYIEQQAKLLNYAAGNENGIEKEKYCSCILDLLNRTNNDGLKIKIIQEAIRNFCGCIFYADLSIKIIESQYQTIVKNAKYIASLLLKIISIYIYIYNEEKAFEFLKIYVENFNLKQLENYLPVAYFAYNKGYKNDRIKIAAKIYENFEKNDKNKTFEKYIKNKKIAIVGNGPSENGSGNGKLIDSYDEVIRFNNFSMSDKIIKDYGKKITIWSKNGCGGGILDDVNFHIIRINPHFMNIKNKFKSYKHYLENGKEFVYFPDELFYEIKDKYSINSPTGGLEMIYWIKKINSDFNENDCFGFSFKQKTASQDGFIMHYDGSSTKSGHSFDKEKNAILKIFEK